MDAVSSKNTYPADPWRLIETTPVESAHAATVFALGNGYVGLRGSREEDGPRPACYVNGFYETWTLEYPENAYGLARLGQSIQAAPDPLALTVLVDGHRLGGHDTGVDAGRRELDLHAGTLTRQTTWRTPAGAVTVRSVRLVSFTRRGLVAARVTVTPDRDATVEVTHTLAPAPHDATDHGADPRAGTKLEAAVVVDRCEAAGARSYLHVTTRQAGVGLGCSVDRRATVAGRAVEPVVTAGDAGALATWSVRAAAGVPLELTVYAWFAGDPDARRSDSDAKRSGADAKRIDSDAKRSVPDAKRGGADAKRSGADAKRIDSDAKRGGADAKRSVPDAGRSGADAKRSWADTGRSGADAALDEALAAGWAGLAREQRVFLDDFWACADVEAGDAGLQQAIRWSIFQTAQASARADGLGVAAKGVTGPGYDGHYFWDMEMYVLPFLTHVAPGAARAALGFRLATLPQARERAAELHLAGALFPWRTIGGREASAYFPAGTAQYHIDADIAHALTQYVNTTGDESIMRQPVASGRAPAASGLDLLVETARLWASLGFWGDDGAFHFHYVTGPDEYSALVDDNVYTNLMARANLRAAAAAVEHWAGDDGPAAEAAEWRRIADGVFVPFDAAAGVHPQDAHFMGRQPWDLSTIPPGNRPLLLHYHPLTIYRHKVLKQADVVLAQILRPADFTPEQRVANFDYYDPLTTGDSTLSAVPQAIGAVDAGHVELGLEYLLQAAYVDLADSHGNSDVGVHVAVAAGLWSALVMGFGGLRDADSACPGAGTAGVSLAPALPAAWASLKFHLLWHGTRLDVAVTRDAGGLATTLTAVGDTAVPLTVWGRPVTVPPGTSLTVRKEDLK